MSGALSKIRDSRKQPERQRSALEYIRDTVAGANKRYWDRQGMLSRGGLAQADLGARQVREGNIPMGLVNALLGPVNYVSSPITALVPTQEEIYDAPEIPGWVKPAAAGAAMTAAMFTPGPKVKAMKIGGEVADAAEEGITAYHGSPHTFDKFDMSKIGTGEGAQAYGHGLYFAEREGTARAYRNKLAPTDGSMAKPDAQAVQDYGAQWDALVQKRRALTASDGRAMPGADAIDGQMDALHAQMVADSIKRNPSLAGGSMYQVRLNVKPDELLDWDRPLSEQSDAVAEALGALQTQFYPVKRGKKWDVLDSSGEFVVGGFKTKREAYAGSLGDFGHEAYKRLGLTSPQSTAKLKSLGIKGIRYKDQGSRDKDGGTYNYVIFDDKLIDILKRYAIPFTLGAGGAAMVSGGDMPPEIAAQMGPEA